jgi:hypothetical protein
MRSAKYQILPDSFPIILDLSQANSLLPASTGVGHNLSSSAQKIAYNFGYAIQAIYTGNLNGTMSLNASLDGVNFSPITGTNVVISPPGAGTTGNFIWDVQSPNYFYTQFAFAASSSMASSAGTMRAILTSKGF